MPARFGFATLKEPRLQASPDTLEDPGHPPAVILVPPVICAGGYLVVAEHYQRLLGSRWTLPADTLMPLDLLAGGYNDAAGYCRVLLWYRWQLSAATCGPLDITSGFFDAAGPWPRRLLWQFWYDPDEGSVLVPQPLVVALQLIQRLELLLHLREFLLEDLLLPLLGVGHRVLLRRLNSWF